MGLYVKNYLINDIECILAIFEQFINRIVTGMVTAYPRPIFSSFTSCFLKVFHRP